jgi:hypothetical protein
MLFEAKPGVRRIMEVDVTIRQQIAALDTAVHEELGKLDRKDRRPRPAARRPICEAA